METSFSPNRANGWGKAFLTQKSFQKDVLSPLSITWTLFCNICPRAFRLLKESTLWLIWGAIFSIDKVPPKGISPKLVSPYPFCQKTLVPFLAPFTSREFNLSQLIEWIPLLSLCPFQRKFLRSCSIWSTTFEEILNIEERCGTIAKCGLD